MDFLFGQCSSPQTYDPRLASARIEGRRFGRQSHAQKLASSMADDVRRPFTPTNIADV
jgi:hypothetical protein